MRFFCRVGRCLRGNNQKRADNASSLRFFFAVKNTKQTVFMTVFLVLRRTLFPETTTSPVSFDIKTRFSAPAPAEFDVNGVSPVVKIQFRHVESSRCRRSWFPSSALRPQPVHKRQTVAFPRESFAELKLRRCRAANCSKRGHFFHARPPSS